MERKERLLSYFNSNEYIPLKLRELKIVLDVPETDCEEFENIIYSLQREGKILISKRGRIVPVLKSENVAGGKLICNPSGRFGFVVRDDGEDIYVSVRDMGAALNGDSVLVKITGSRSGKPEGSVMSITEKSKAPVVGVVITKKGKLLRVRADDKRFFKEIFVSHGESMDATVGERVAVESIRVNPDGKVYGKITARLGHNESLHSLIESTIIEHKIEKEFMSAVLDEVHNISEEIKWDESSRENLTSLITFTIDGELARDFDDAVSIENLPHGVSRLGVHIADVSEYVTENTALDASAFRRGTSVYLPDRVIPMLPEKLSNGVCSLNPGVDRLTLSVFMDIDKDGEVINHRITKSVIRSKERLTYTDVNKLLEEGDKNLEERYKHILPQLKAMEEVASVLRKKRFDRGAIDFDFPESEIVTDSDGNPAEVRYVHRGVSNRMIEEFMLVANETVAEFAYWSELPCIYRSHEAPTGDKLTAFKQFLSPFGIYIKGKNDDNNPVKPKAFEQIIQQVKGTPIERIVSKTMLRSLMKADYKPVNTGHFGLAAKYYCHFTSPIRRYPDLVVHRSIKAMLDGKNTPDFGFVSSAAKRASDTEIEAELCERDCDDILKAAYMNNFIGMDFEGVVSGVKGFGMFVELKANGIEGLVRVENMDSDYFICDEEKQCLMGEHTGIKYTVGDEVSVFVAKSDIVSRRIDFVLSEDFSRDIFKKLR